MKGYPERALKPHVELDFIVAEHGGDDVVLAAMRGDEQTISDAVTCILLNAGLDMVDRRWNHISSVAGPTAYALIGMPLYNPADAQNSMFGLRKKILAQGPSYKLTYKETPFSNEEIALLYGQDLLRCGTRKTHMSPDYLVGKDIHPLPEYFEPVPGHDCRMPATLAIVKQAQGFMSAVFTCNHHIGTLTDSAKRPVYLIDGNETVVQDDHAIEIFDVFPSKINMASQLPMDPVWLPLMQGLRTPEIDHAISTCYASMRQTHRNWLPVGPGP